MSTMITTTRASKLLGVSVGRIRQLIYEGKLDAVMIGRDWLINLEEIKNVKIYGKSGRPKKILEES